MSKRASALTEKVGLPPVATPPGALIGAHLSIAGGTWRAPERGQALGCSAVQLFVKSNNRWEGKALGDDEGERFRQARAAAGNLFCFAHNSYLINMASPDLATWRRSIWAMEDEIVRCAALGLPGLVAHPGAGLGSSEAEGLQRVADALDAIFEKTPNAPVQVWLETTCGQGSNLGWRFEHLAEIIGRVGDKSRVGVCLDTCHVFAAGYDLRDAESWANLWREFDSVIGRDWLRAIHVNDSKRGLGSRVDRHEELGKGAIGPEAFRLLMRDPSLATIPKVIETPKGDAGERDWDNLKFLVDCLGGAEKESSA